MKQLRLGRSPGTTSSGSAWNNAILSENEILMSHVSSFDFATTYPGNKIYEIVALNCQNYVLVTLYTSKRYLIYDYIL